MVGKDIYTNCGTVGQTEWPDGDAEQSGPMETPNGVARRRGPTEWPDGVARRRAHGCVTETGNGPTEDYIRAGGLPFWALSSCAQSHLQEMRERTVLMSESGSLRGEFRKECFPPHCFYN
jgi:hypothetical protein